MCNKEGKKRPNTALGGLTFAHNIPAASLAPTCWGREGARRGGWLRAPRSGPAGARTCAEGAHGEVQARAHRSGWAVWARARAGVASPLQRRLAAAECLLCPGVAWTMRSAAGLARPRAEVELRWRERELGVRGQGRGSCRGEGQGLEKEPKPSPYPSPSPTLALALALARALARVPPPYRAA